MSFQNSHLCLGYPLTFSSNKWYELTTSYSVIRRFPLKSWLIYFEYCLVFNIFIASYSLKMLQIAKDPNTLGNVRWELAVCMFVVSIVVYFKLWKSTESSGRVLHLTATLPFAMLAVLLVRSLMLDGAEIGLEYFLFKLRWELLLDSKVR